MPERAPDFWTYSGSTYWDFGDRIIRWSNHWGIINNCYWYLDGRSPGGSSIAGECKYIEFKPVEQRLEWLYGNGDF